MKQSNNTLKSDFIVTKLNLRNWWLDGLRNIHDKWFPNLTSNTLITQIKVQCLLVKRAADVIRVCRWKDKIYLTLKFNSLIIKLISRTKENDKLWFLRTSYHLEQFINSSFEDNNSTTTHHPSRPKMCTSTAIQRFHFIRIKRIIISLAIATSPVMRIRKNTTHERYFSYIP